jgi:hypothetical protein
MYVLYRASKHKNCPLKMEETCSVKNLPNYMVYRYRKTKYLHHLRNIKSPVVLLFMALLVTVLLFAVALPPRNIWHSDFQSWRTHTYISKCIKLPKSEALCIWLLQSVFNMKLGDISESLSLMRNTLFPPPTPPPSRLFQVRNWKAYMSFGKQI